MGSNFNSINLLEIPKRESININCEEFAISLLKNYGDTLYLLLNFEGITDSQKIGELLCKIVEKSCLKINSPEAYKAKPAIFNSALQVLKNLHGQYSPITLVGTSPSFIATNPYLHILSSLSFEKRFAYLLKIRNNLTYRELETVLNLHRAEISKLLTEAREQIRLTLSSKNMLPFNQRTLLCSITYQYLSPYIDNELNILHTIDVQNHIKDCDDCLKILADHQYIEKQFENLPSIQSEKIIQMYLAASRSRNESLNHNTIQNTLKAEYSKENELKKNPRKYSLKSVFQFLKSLFKIKK